MSGRAATLLALCVTACADPALPDCTPTPGPTAWIVDHGWHTDVAIPASEATGPLAAYRAIFPGAQTLVFGFGKRTFLTAKADSLQEYLLGPIPGPAAIQATGLTVTPERAYAGLVVALPLPPGGADALSRFLWDSVEKTAAQTPRLIGPAWAPGSLFYAASHSYSLGYTCNTWTADALQHAGLPMPGAPVLASGVMHGAAAIPGACSAPAP